jgi:hypothetical protein
MGEAGSYRAVVLFCTVSDYGLNIEANGRAFLVIDIDLHEGRHAHNVDAFLGQVTLGYHDGLNRLVDGPGSDCLYFGMVGIAHDAGNGTGNSGRTGMGRHFDDVHCYQVAYTFVYLHRQDKIPFIRSKIFPIVKAYLYPKDTIKHVKKTLSKYTKQTSAAWNSFP